MSLGPETDFITTKTEKVVIYKKLSGPLMNIRRPSTFHPPTPQSLVLGALLDLIH